MQPYFFPYLGYFSLIEACDVFVLYDDIKYTKRGWINRNRIASHGNIVPLTLPLKRAPDRLDIREREISSEFSGAALMRKLRGAYGSSPNWGAVESLVQDCLEPSHTNLFDFLFESLVLTCRLLGITTPLRVSSDLGDFSDLRGQDRVIALTRRLGGSGYINPAGGRSLYQHSAFAEAGLSLSFLEVTHRDSDATGILPDLLNSDRAESRLSVLDDLAVSGVRGATIAHQTEYTIRPAHD